MSLARPHPDDRTISGINVTPFVDIALVLLIIFMVTARFMVSPPSIRLDLPRTESGPRTVINHAAQIALTGSGGLFVDMQPVDDAQLAVIMSRLAEANPQVRAIIAAEPSVQHGRVVHVIDVLRGVGVTRFALQTDLPSTTPIAAH